MPREWECTADRAACSMMLAEPPHGDPLAQGLMDGLAQGAVKVWLTAQDKRKAVDGVIAVIHEHFDVLKDAGGKVLCLVHGQQERLFLLIVKVEERNRAVGRTP